MAKIYLSSTYSDLKDHREAVYRTLRRLRHDVIAMEDYVATDQRPVAKCLADVAACDLYVGIFAWRYGYVPDTDNPSGASITELEYRTAVAAGKPCLLFLLEKDALWPRKFMDGITGDGERGQHIDALRAELEKATIVGFFSTPDHLASLVSPAVVNWQKEHDSSQPGQAGAPGVQEPGVTSLLPREVIWDVYIAYGGMDKELADGVASGLTTAGRRSLLSPDALFVRDKGGFQALDKQVSQSHVAVVVLSDALFAHLEPERGQTAVILEILRSRTGRLIAVCRTESALRQAINWGIDASIDASNWAGSNNPIPFDVILRLKDAISPGLPKEATRVVGLPFVLVAMTRSEAEAMAQRGETLVQHGLGVDRAKQFRTLVDALHSHIRLDLGAHAQHYGPSRYAWSPFFDPGNDHSMCATILDVVKRRNAETWLQQRGRSIKAQFYSFDPLLSGQDGPQYEIYRGIARTGCVVVVDELSMLHPDILNAFEQSPLKNSPQAALVTISPFDPYRLGPDEMIETAVRRQLGDAISRFGEDFDPRCEFGVGNERRFKRWLFSSLPGTLDAVLSPPMDPLKMAQFVSEVGQQPRSDAPALLEGGAL
jgi:hypothetical protein